MATATPGAILPQYQGDYYTLQNRQALAQALMGQAMQNQASQLPTNMPVMPKFNIGTGLAQLGQAYLAAKMAKDVGQGYRDLGNAQWQAFGGTPATQTAPAAQASPDAAVTPPAQSYPVGPSGTPSAAPDQSTAQPAPQAQVGTTPMNPLGMNPAMAYSYYSANPGEYFKTQAQAYKPAEIVSQLRAAGIDPGSALGRRLAQDSLAKANYIPPVSLRPGGYMYDPSTGHTQQMPHVPDGFTAVQGQDGQWQIVPVQGGLGAMGAAAKATAGGKAAYELKQVWDPTANNGKGGYVQQTVSNVADAANGNLPAPIRNNNPGALMPGGKLAQYPDMQTGIAALDQNLQSYGKQGVNTISGVISKWAPPNENDTQAYIKDVSSRLGIPPDQQINLSDPLQRHAISAAIALHENGPQGVFGGARPSGAIASEPPLGLSNAASNSQVAPSKLMADSYSSMSAGDNNYQASREALLGMMALAKKQGAGDNASRFLPEGLATRLNSDATEYQKLHATYVGLQGKALGSGGTDAARETINNAVPTFDKPQTAKLAGLQTQLNNLDLSHLKTQFLTPVYQQGDEKAYTQKSAAFDQNIKPSMIPVLQMSGDQQRAAIQAAIKADPSVRPNFEWAFNNGMIK